MVFLIPYCASDLFIYNLSTCSDFPNSLLCLSVWDLFKTLTMVLLKTSTRLMFSLYMQQIPISSAELLFGLRICGLFYLLWGYWFPLKSPSHLLRCLFFLHVQLIFHLSCISFFTLISFLHWKQSFQWHDFLSWCAVHYLVCHGKNSNQYFIQLGS